MVIGVISDIHSHEEDIEKKNRGGFYYPSMPDSPISKNPFSSLKKLIKESEIEFDFILSPGDYAHKIDLKGLKSAWEQLKLIKFESGAKSLIGTIGNHDVSSRGDGDSFKAVKEFDIDFPVFGEHSSQEIKNKFFGEHFFSIEDNDKDVFFLIINSSFNHWSENEARSGKVDKDSIEKMKSLIESSAKKVKIGLVHHHPIVHETGHQDTADIIVGSEELKEVLEKLDLTVHGHKHNFRFTNLLDRPKNSNILAAGSFSCFKDSLKVGEYNAFHIINFEPLKVEHCINPGYIDTYNFDPNSGWKLTSNLYTGFGCCLQQGTLVDKLGEYFVSNKTKIIYWNDLLLELQFIKYTRSVLISDVLDELVDQKVVQKVFYNSEGNIDAILNQV